MSGRPIVRGTRILPDAIVDSYDLGESIEKLLYANAPLAQVFPISVSFA